ncbi:hypothetical protein HPB49_002659 [Dermacentor silvarum]|uniref:Uncharacterized protein n=1 Tax=Dermacentor silvarum TaxID=543639 RepID=A0ACB8CD02_DERSI|nr:uncharacterized protein LOC125946865 [Dermacentor silvarum]KAH7940628.1 hypothetical protein HPB49_002659 [Dermacentor silvarum]
METLRMCGDDYVPFGNRVSYPDSGQPFKDKCEIELRQIKCSLKFADECLKGVPKTAAFITLNAAEDYTGAACTVGTETNEEFRKVIGCVNSVGTQVNACMRSLKRDLQRSIVKAPTKDVIYHTCCSYGDAEGCIHQALTPCNGVGADEYVSRLLSDVLGGTLELVCGNYTVNSDACKARPKLPQLGPDDRTSENFVELIIGAANTIGRKD